MVYKENSLQYEDYVNLRQSVQWKNMPKEQTIRALENSLYDVIAIDNEKVIAMGRLIGDGLYYIAVDIIVAPEYQNKGIGSEIISRLLTYAYSQTPLGGRISIQLIAEKGKEAFYEKFGFKRIPHEYCGSGMRKVINKSINLP